MNFEISFGGKICNFISLYRSPSQWSDTFEDFADNLELNLDKIANKCPYLLVVLGDFNIKSSNWHKHDKTAYEGSILHHMNTKYGIINVQMLIKFNKQLNSFLGKNRLEI